MSTSTRNLKPSSISSKTYARYYTYGTKYGEFKYAARTYGATANSSAGQAMPAVDTRRL